MNKKIFMPIAILSIAVALSTLAGCEKKSYEGSKEVATGTSTVMNTGVSDTTPKKDDTEGAKKDGTTSTGKEDKKVETKEFTMTSFVEMVDGKPHPQYSLTGIIVKKGDLVRIKVTVTKGTHNFNIDEFNVHSETPLNQETVVEFTADKAGTFIYYCSMPGHRANGHWGTLIVTE